MQSVSTLSPKCKYLYKEYLASKKQLQYSLRVRRAMTFCKQKYFEKLTANMSPLAKKLFWMQIKLCTKSKMGRRYTEDEKLIALSIMKQSPKAYKYLQKIFILPSKGTLNHLIQGLRIESGINPQIFSCVRKEVRLFKFFRYHNLH